jgi:hypothetical protein
VEDPEGEHSRFNIFNDSQNASELRDEEERIEDIPLNFKRDDTIQQIQLVENNLLLIGPHSVRIVPRSN